MFTKFAVNKTSNEVQMIDGKIKIVAGGWEGLTKSEVEHEDVIYALRRKWIKLEDKEPKQPQSPEKPVLKTYSADNEEYKGEKEPRVKVTKLGTS